MPQHSIERLGDTRIQILFHDRAASFRLAGDVTLEQIASTLGAISRRYPDRPVAVYVTLKRSDA